MRGTWHFGAPRLHIMGTCRWCTSRADQATQESSESMLTDPRRLPFLSWARFPRLGCDKPENFCQRRGEICGGGLVANFGGARMCAKQAQKFRRKIFATGKTEFRHFPAMNKIKSSPFPPKLFRHVQKQLFHYSVCLVPPLTQPHWLALSYISKPSKGACFLFWLCERSWKRAQFLQVHSLT